MSEIDFSLTIRKVLDRLMNRAKQFLAAKDDERASEAMKELIHFWITVSHHGNE